MYADGSRHTGQWHKNKKHGPAVFISDNGRTFEGLFDNDAMVGKMGEVHTNYRRIPLTATYACALQYCILCSVEYGNVAVVGIIAANLPLLIPTSSILGPQQAIGRTKRSCMRQIREIAR